YSIRKVEAPQPVIRGTEPDIAFWILRPEFDYSLVERSRMAEITVSEVCARFDQRMVGIVAPDVGNLGDGELVIAVGSKAGGGTGAQCHGGRRHYQPVPQPTAPACHSRAPYRLARMGLG